MIPVPRSHANFRDPVGLLLRMLRSGDRAARAVLFREASAVGLAPLDRALEVLERRRLRNAPAAPGPIVLIVGGSRAGTTLTYQVLARYLPVTYFSNLSGLFPRAPLTASLLFRRSRRPRSGGDTFHNYYGNTAELAGPNDGFHIWNRWLGADRYRAPQSLDDATVADMRRFLAAWTAAFGRPLLNKNNRNADCVALLGRVLPEATFVVVRRDPVEVAQSLLVAREHVQGDKRYRWGVGSLDGSEDPMGYVDSVCRQVVEVDRRLTEGAATLAPERLIEVRYERFCTDAYETIDELSRRVWRRPADAGGGRFQVPLRASSARDRVSAAERERIERCLGELREQQPART